MADEYVVQEVAEFTTGAGAEFWRITMIRPDGELVHHLTPKATLEWRAAEYGLTDPAQILDMVLHARFAEHQGSEFYAAESTAAARQGFEDRVRRAKQAVRIVPPTTGPNPLDTITRHGIDPARVQAKREQVDVRRWLRHGGRLPNSPGRGSSHDRTPPTRSL